MQRWQWREDDCRRRRRPKSWGARNDGKMTHARTVPRILEKRPSAPPHREYLTIRVCLSLTLNGLN
jgi:hypothetical protein